MSGKLLEPEPKVPLLSTRPWSAYGETFGTRAEFECRPLTINSAPGIFGAPRHRRNRAILEGCIRADEPNFRLMSSHQKASFIAGQSVIPPNLPRPPREAERRHVRAAIVNPNVDLLCGGTTTGTFYVKV